MRRLNHLRANLLNGKHNTQYEIPRSRFKTGDIAVKHQISGSYKILGRASVDIIKSGGYKISALEIEKELLEFTKIRDVAVVGIPSQEWGESIGTLVTLQEVRCRN